MKWRAAIAILTGLVLVFFTLKSQVRGAGAYLQTVDDVRTLHELDARLDRDALEAEGGLVLNYDELNVTLREMARRQNAIEQSTADFDDSEVRARIRASRNRLSEKEALIETFESRNSVFRNSLTYLPVVAQAAGVESAKSRAAVPIGAELTTLLANIVCRSECDDAALARVREAVAALAATRDQLQPEERKSLELVLRHAAVFADHAPKVKRAIGAVLATDGQPYENLFVALQTFHERAASRADVFRSLFLILSVILAVAVMTMVFRIRQNARALGDALEDLARKKNAVEEKKTELSHLNQSLETRVVERTRELTRSHDQYRLLLESSRAIPWEMRPDSCTFSYVGPQARTALGFPASDWLREAFLEQRIPQEDRQRTLALFKDESEHSEIEFAAQDAEGQMHWFRCYVTRSADADGRIVPRGLLFEVSAQRILEAELRASQKLEGIGRLASGIAHEINTPVQFVGDNVTFLTEAFSSLTGLVEKYRALFGTSPQIHAAEDAADLDFILSNVPDTLRSSTDGLERIATIVRSMKEFAHPDQKQKVHVDLNANIQSTLIIARNEYKHVAELVTDFADLPAVLCHPGEVNQVMLNIIVNAAHAIGDVVEGNGGLGKISVTTRVDGDNAVVTIADTGSGIATENRSRVFEPFFTTKRIGRGTGQGLAIARSIIVDKHQGQISFASEPDVGTTFTIRLPIEARANSALKAAAA